MTPDLQLRIRRCRRCSDGSDASVVEGSWRGCAQSLVDLWLREFDARPCHLSDRSCSEIVLAARSSNKLRHEGYYVALN